MCRELFTKLPHGLAELSLRFGFDNAVLKLAAGKLFEKSANQQVAALCQRAEQVYGPSKL